MSTSNTDDDITEDVSTGKNVAQLFGEFLDKLDEGREAYPSAKATQKAKSILRFLNPNSCWSLNFDPDKGLEIVERLSGALPDLLKATHLMHFGGNGTKRMVVKIDSNGLSRTSYLPLEE